MKAKLVFLERKLRVLLYGFCVYALLDCIMFNFLQEKADTITHHYLFIIIGGLFRFFAGIVIDEEVEVTKKICEWDWNSETKSDYYCTEFNGLVWIGAFYYLVQMAICMIFFPWVEEIKIGERYAYPYIFLFNSVIIYILYRLTIIKINYTKQEDDIHS